MWWCEKSVKIGRFQNYAAASVQPKTWLSFANKTGAYVPKRSRIDPKHANKRHTHQRPKKWRFSTHKEAFEATNARHEHQLLAHDFCTSNAEFPWPYSSYELSMNIWNECQNKSLSMHPEGPIRGQCGKAHGKTRLVCTKNLSERPSYLLNQLETVHTTNIEPLKLNSHYMNTNKPPDFETRYYASSLEKQT